MGKWWIHGPKHHKDNPSQSRKHICIILQLDCKHNTVEFLGNDSIPMFSEKIRGQKHFFYDKTVDVKPASNDLGVYVNKFGKTSVVWRYTLQSIGPSGITLNY